MKPPFVRSFVRPSIRPFVCSFGLFELVERQLWKANHAFIRAWVEWRCRQRQRQRQRQREWQRAWRVAEKSMCGLKCECCRCGKSTKSLKIVDARTDKLELMVAVGNRSDSGMQQPPPMKWTNRVWAPTQRNHEYPHQYRRCFKRFQRIAVSIIRIIAHRRHRNTPITEQLF